MFRVGEKIKFKRSDGTWSVGLVKEQNKEFYIVQWLANNQGVVGEKKVHMLNFRKFTNYKLYFLCIFTFIMLVDSFFYLRKVRFQY
jgi:hypothetical protein